MRAVIETNTFFRPLGICTGMSLSQAIDVYAYVGELIDVIAGPLRVTPVMLPVVQNQETVATLVDQVDGILLPLGNQQYPPCKLWKHDSAKAAIRHCLRSNETKHGHC